MKFTVVFTVEVDIAGNYEDAIEFANEQAYEMLAAGSELDVRQVETDDMIIEC